MPWAARFSEPAQITSSALRDRRARPCSPSAQRRASARLLLPDPFGPTTALIPPPNSTSVRSANDLNPWRRSARSRAGELIFRTRPRPSPGRLRRRLGVRRSPAVLRRARRPNRLERLERCGGLRGAARRPLACAQRRAVDPDLDPEQLLVVRPARVDDPVLRSRAGSPL